MTTEDSCPSFEAEALRWFAERSDSAGGYEPATDFGGNARWYAHRGCGVPTIAGGSMPTFCYGCDRSTAAGDWRPMYVRTEE